MFIAMHYDYETFNLMCGLKQETGIYFVCYYKRDNGPDLALTDSYREFWL